MPELIYDAIGAMPSDPVSSMMFVVGMLQAIFLIPAVIMLCSMRAQPWTTSTKTRLGSATSRQVLLGLLAVSIGLGPVLTIMFGVTPGPAHKAYELTACLGLLAAYPTFAIFRSMIPGSMEDIGDEPPYNVAARGAGFYLLGVGLLLAPLLMGGHLGDTAVREWRASAPEKHLIAAGSLVRLNVSVVERYVSRSAWLEEHVTFALSSGKEFEIDCTRRSNNVAQADRPFPCLAASIGDKLTVGYVDQVASDGLVPALQIWRDGGHG